MHQSLGHLISTATPAHATPKARETVGAGVVYNVRVGPGGQASQVGNAHSRSPHLCQNPCATFQAFFYFHEMKLVLLPSTNLLDVAV